MPARVIVTDEGSIITLPCGAVVESNPHDTDEYRATARSLGYGEGPDAALRMAQEHDVLHCRLVEWLGIPESFSLRVAVGLGADPELARIEEAAVLAVQRLMRRAGGRLPSGEAGDGDHSSSSFDSRDRRPSDVAV